MELRATILAVATSVVLATPAQARNTEHFFNVKEAVESEIGQEKLLAVPIFMQGQEHPDFGRELMTVTTERSTRGVFRSDLRSCQVAFLSALIVLQQRAEIASAAAIVNIVSLTRGERTESDTEFRCIAGATIVHAALRGTLVAAK